MPTRKRRVLTFPERKLRPVPEAAARRLTAQYLSAPSARVYCNMQGKMFAAYARQPNPENKYWVAVVSTLGPVKTTKARATAEFAIRAKLLQITDLSKSELGWIKQTGELMFRAILNEATRIAKKEKVNIWIEADNEKLREYYKTFGFQFSDPKNPMEGILTIFKPRGSAKR